VADEIFGGYPWYRYQTSEPARLPLGASTALRASLLQPAALGGLIRSST
jgi:asparagine synthetase B (glutamine-hydrolysing)